MKDKSRERLPHETLSPEREEQLRADRRATLLVLAGHVGSTVEFVEQVSRLGLEEELEEQLRRHPRWRTAVTKARERSTWKLPVDLDEEEEYR